jgi:hypothetical protein
LKKNIATLTQICDAIASGILSQAEAARRCDVSVATYWSWISQSQKGNPDFIITYCEEQMQFFEAVKLARKVALHDVLGLFEQRMHYGRDELVYFQGRPCWKEDESLAGLDDEMISILGLPDRFERINGQRVQLRIHHEPPIAGVIKLLEANFPKQYGQRSTVDINQRTQLGVTVVDQRKPKAPPPQVEVLPPRVIAAPADDDLSDLLGDDTEEGTFSEIEQAPTAPMASQPEPTPAPDTRIVDERYGTLTNEQAAMLNRLRAGIPANATRQPRTLIQTSSAIDRDDLDPARVGRGEPPKGGVKIA